MRALRRKLQYQREQHDHTPRNARVADQRPRLARAHSDAALEPAEISRRLPWKNWCGCQAKEAASSRSPAAKRVATHYFLQVFPDAQGFGLNTDTDFARHPEQNDPPRRRPIGK